MLFKVFSEKLSRYLSLDNFAILVKLCTRVEVPPPSTRFEELKYQRSIIATTDEAFIMLEILPLEVQNNSIMFIQSVIELIIDLLFGMAYEDFILEVIILGQQNFQLLG